MFQVVMMGLSYLMQPKPPDIVGPKLNDLKVQSSAYGLAIPKVYGSVRLAGNVIWASDLVETSHSQDSGGKGGKSQTSTWFTYSVSFAIGLCATQIQGIGRIWANGELIYNNSSSDIATSIASSTVSNSVTLYLGTETQTADPTMQTYLGVGNVPGYRGLAYIVFDNLQLEKYGNRMPNIEIEVFQTTTASYAQGTTNQVSGTTRTWTCCSGYLLGGSGLGIARSFCGNWDNSYSSYDVKLVEINASGAETLLGSFTSISNQPVATICQTDEPIFFQQVFSQVYQCIDQNFVVDINNNPTNRIFRTTEVLGLTQVLVVKFGNILILADSLYNKIEIYSWSTQARIGSITVPSGTSPTWVVCDNNYIYISYSNNTIQRYSTSTFIYIDTPYTLPSTSLFLAVDSITNTLYSIYASNAVQVQNLTRGILVCSLPHALYAQNSMFRVYKGIIYSYDGANSYIAISITTPISIGSSVPLSSVVTDICLVMTPSDLDVSQLTDSVDGYIVSSQMSARSAIEPLQKAYYFDSVEHDGKVKFVKRGSSAVVTIPESDLAVHESGTQLPDTTVVNRKQEVELPNEVNVQYLDNTIAYQTGSQIAQRQTVDTKNKVSLDLALALTSTKAKQIADVTMYDLWNDRTSVEISNGWKYAYLEPTDVINITTSTGTRTVRITESEFNKGINNVKTVLEDANIYTQNAAAPVMLAPSTNITLPSVTNLQLLDIPLLQDADNGIGAYMAACGGSGWPGCQIYKSTDNGVTWNSYDNPILTPTVIGKASTTLGNFTLNNIFDETNTVTVVLNYGTLSSTTEINILNGINAALLGNEIIQFKNAVLTAANTYVLSGLLRGRLGTEWAISTHTSSDRFVALNSTIRTLTSTSSDYNIARKYKAVTFNTYIEDALVTTFTNNLTSLKPLSPVLIGGGRAGSAVTVNWTRRGRLTTGWNDYSEVPIGESSESYSIDLYNGSTLINTITTTTPTFTASTYPVTSVDPNTVALVNFAGVNNSTVITDLKGHTFTAIGTAKISTDKYLPWGTSSLYLDGNYATSSSYVTSPDSIDWHFTGAHTIEMWIYPVSNKSAWLFNQTAGTGDACPIRFDLGVTGTITILGSTDNTNWSTNITSTITCNLTTWNHIAVSDDGTTCRVYINGVLAISTATWTKIDSAQILRIGGGHATLDREFNGFIDGFRVTKGLARYTADFTPPTTAFTVNTVTQTTLPNPLTVKVYQISATAGRGFPGSAII